MNAVAAAAEYHPDNINRLFLREDRLKSLTGICKKLAERKRPYKLCEDDELERICKTNHHQGVVAMIFAPQPEPLTRDDLDEWAASGKTGLVLHSLGNDHNLGAIIRSAAFFDAPLIVLSEEDHETQITTSAYRVAEGGMEHVRIRTVKDTAAFIRDASKVLVTVGADSRARQRIRDLPDLILEKKPARQGTAASREHQASTHAVRNAVAIILGNEENGLPREVKESCTVLVRIPGTGLMDSLNVAQAANLFLYELFR